MKKREKKERQRRAYHILYRSCRFQKAHVLVIVGESVKTSHKCQKMKQNLMSFNCTHLSMSAMDFPSCCSISEQNKVTALFNTSAINGIQKKRKIGEWVRNNSKDTENLMKHSLEMVTGWRRWADFSLAELSFFPSLFPVLSSREASLVLCSTSAGGWADHERR